MTSIFPGRSSLSGRRIRVTRPREQAAALCHKLAALAAEPIPFPTIEIVPMGNYAALEDALRQLGPYQ